MIIFSTLEELKAWKEKSIKFEFFIITFTKCFAGEDGTGYGLEVKVLHCDLSPESTLAQELKRLTGTESFPLGDITILSPVSFKNSCANRRNSFSKSRIHVLDGGRAHRR